MNLQFKLSAVCPRVFMLQMNRYDLAMTFLRAEEYYESVNSQFRGQVFTLAEYMRWYSFEHDNVFSYAKDWSGFNVPSMHLEGCYESHTEILQHDQLMLRVMRTCRFLSGPGNPYYLIGAKPEDSKVIPHEIAHALYSTNLSYREEMNKCLEGLDWNKKCKMVELLTSMGYGENVHADETHAFMATGLNSHMNSILADADCIPFIDVFKKYAGDLAEPALIADTNFTAS